MSDAERAAVAIQMRHCGEARLDIGGAAHEQQAIERIKQLIEAEFPADGRHDQRHAARPIEHRGQVFLADQMIRLRTEHAPVRGYADDRAF